MKKLLLSIALVLLPLMAGAQGLKFGCFSYEEVLTSMPAYTAAQEQLAALRAQYDAEAERNAAEFNSKYEEFIEVQRTLAPTILNKRQAELQELRARGIAFRQDAEAALAQAEADAMAPLHQRLAAAVSQLGKQGGYAFILNTDGRAVPFVDAAQVDDVTETLKGLLK